jgi:hypothetical protein
VIISFGRRQSTVNSRACSTAKCCLGRDFKENHSGVLPKNEFSITKKKKMKNVVSVDEMENADADLLVHEDVPSNPEQNFQEMKEPITNQELCCEDTESDGENDIVSEEC